MERLTYRIYPSREACLAHGLDAIWSKKLKKLRYGIITKAVDRLAAYEDSGLSPEEVQKMAMAKAEGRLVVLPCKVGDTVYAVQGGEIIQCEVTEITICKSGISFIRLFSTDDRLADFRYEHFQKTVFLTREEAEKALGDETT